MVDRTCLLHVLISSNLHVSKVKEKLAEKLKTASDAEINALIEMYFNLREQATSAIYLPRLPDRSRSPLAVQFTEELKNLENKMHQWHQSMNLESHMKYNQLWFLVWEARMEEQQDRRDQSKEKAVVDRASKRQGERLECEASMKRSKGP